MPLQRLRTTLARTYVVDIENSAAVAAEVNNLARPNRRRKTARPYAQLAANTPLRFSALDLLRKIGELTTPKGVNFARLSASWATRRYVWTITGGAGVGAPTATRMRLSVDARRMERHQKTLLSDEFGIGFAGLVAERHLNAPRFVDVEFALQDPVRYFGTRPGRTKRPDYLMWGAQTPVFIVECKGCQTARHQAIRQLRRGLEQLPGIRIQGRASEQLVIGAFMDRQHTTIFLLDPPDDAADPKPIREGRGTHELVRKVTENSYEVTDIVEFDEKVRHGQTLGLLRWIGQHETAARLQERFFGVAPKESLPNAELQTVRRFGEEFFSVSEPLAPELGLSSIHVLRGLRPEVRRALEKGELPDTMTESVGASSADRPISIGPLGTVLAIDGL